MISIGIRAAIADGLRCRQARERIGCDPAHVLMDERVDRPRQEIRFGLGIVVVPDEDDPRRKPRFLNRIGRARNAASNAVDADDIRLRGECFAHARARHFGIVVSGDEFDALQIGALGAQHATEAALALFVRAIKLAAPHDRELAGAAAEAAHQQAGGAAGRAIVEAEIAEMIDAGDIGQHGDDRNVERAQAR